MNQNEHIKMIISARRCDQKWKTCNEKNHITDRPIKRHDSTERKLKTIIKHSQVTSTSKKCIINPKKAALSFKFIKKKQGLSGSQDEKERKTASTVTTTFFGQKITRAQICFCNGG